MYAQVQLYRNIHHSIIHSLTDTLKDGGFCQHALLLCRYPTFDVVQLHISKPPSYYLPIHYAQHCSNCLGMLICLESSNTARISYQYSVQDYLLEGCHIIDRLPHRNIVLCSGFGIVEKDGRTDGRTAGQTDDGRRTDGRRTDGRTTDGRTTDGRTDRHRTSDQSAWHCV